VFVAITAYAIRASALSLHYSLAEMMRDRAGSITSGELILKEASAGRMISTAIFTRWQAGESG
jgi:23S rRNA (cytosine1962-C5)-methyltransferase